MITGLKNNPYGTLCGANDCAEKKIVVWTFLDFNFCYLICEWNVNEWMNEIIISSIDWSWITLNTTFDVGKMRDFLCVINHSFFPLFTSTIDGWWLLFSFFFPFFKSLLFVLKKFHEKKVWYACKI